MFGPTLGLVLVFVCQGGTQPTTRERKEAANSDSIIALIATKRGDHELLDKLNVPDIPLC